MLFLASSVLVGVAGVWLLPIKRLYRAVVSLPYGLAAAAATLMQAFPLVCAYFGDCL
jgi:hypothetical protein